MVSAEKIEVVAPLRVSVRTIHDFVCSQQQWVITATNKVAEKNQNIKKLGPDKFVDGAMLPFVGKQVKLSIKKSATNRQTVQFKDNDLTVYVGYQSLDHSEQWIRISLIHWMKKEALKKVKEYVDLHAKQFNLHPRSIHIRQQKSRWGSCGIHNDIYLNWLLILAPAPVMEYVVVHELCHIQERNHSSRFWSLVEQHLVDYKSQRQWLKKNGSSLMQGL